MPSSCFVELLQLFVLSSDAQEVRWFCLLSKEKEKEKKQNKTKTKTKKKKIRSSARRLHKQLKLFVRSHPSNRHELFLKGRMRLAAPGTSVRDLELEELVKSELYVRLRLTPHHVDPQEEIAPFWECHLNVKHMLSILLDHSSHVTCSPLYLPPPVLLEKRKEKEEKRLQTGAH